MIEYLLVDAGGRKPEVGEISINDGSVLLEVGETCLRFKLANLQMAINSLAQGQRKQASDAMKGRIKGDDETGGEASTGTPEGT